MKHSAGKWDPKEPPVYFIASNMESLIYGGLCHSHLLVAVNELEGKKQLDILRALLDQDKTVFLDSGVFNLANSHAKAHDMRMDVALGLAPEEIDGFDELFDRYVALAREFGDRVWGYIEIDQGGMQNKVRTRARLEALGLRPIPVYHPLNDGWDYFDELAQGYDRICFGNVVQADPPVRKRLVATAWERRRQYPDLWIHLLGLTPTELTNAFALNSCDSSTWLNLVRWPDSFTAKAANKPLWRMGNLVSYNMDAEPEATNGHRKARALGGYESAIMMRNLRGLTSAYERHLGVSHVTGRP
jgi:hypothetical protein